jgi:hypothetical protein
LNEEKAHSGRKENIEVDARRCSAEASHRGISFDEAFRTFDQIWWLPSRKKEQEKIIMAIHTKQATIPTGGGPVVISSSMTSCRAMILQNNSSHAMRVGGQNPSDAVLSATVGYSLAASGGVLSIAMDNYFCYASEWYVFGTAADVLDILYVT